MKTIFFERPYCTICYYPEKSLGMGVWEGFLRSAEYREAFKQGLALIKQQKLTKYLLDNRKLKTIRHPGHQVRAFPDLQGEVGHREAHAGEEVQQLVEEPGLAGPFLALHSRKLSACGAA